VDFKNIRGYFLNGYPADKRTSNGQIFFLPDRVAGRHYPCPIRSIVIPKPTTHSLLTQVTQLKFNTTTKTYLLLSFLKNKTTETCYYQVLP